MIGQVAHILAENKINIADMLNKSKNEYAYNIIDIDGEIGENIIDKIKNIKDVIMVRILE